MKNLKIMKRTANVKIVNREGPHSIFVLHFAKRIQSDNCLDFKYANLLRNITK